MKGIFYISCITFFTLFALPALAQLQRMEVAPVEDPSRAIPVFRDYPDAAAIVITSSINNLVFDSNVGIIENLSSAQNGEYRLLVQPYRQSITVQAQGFLQLRFNITPSGAREVLFYEVKPAEKANSSLTASGKGIFLLMTNPEGAQILIDGLPDFQAQTPYRFSDYAAQEFNVTLTKPNYDTLTYTMQVEDGETVQEELNLIPSFGYIDINVVDSNGENVDHAEITFNRQGSLSDPPVIDGYTTIPKGRLEVNIKANGYYAETKLVPLEAGEKREVTIELSQKFSYVNFQILNTSGKELNDVSVDLSAAEVIEEENDMNGYVPLLSGTQSVTFISEGYQERNEILNVPEGETFTKEIILLNPSEYDLLPAKVTIASDVGSNIIIKDSFEEEERFTGTLNPGRYQITIDHPYNTFTKQIFVKPNQDQSFYLPVLPSRKKALAFSAAPGVGHIYTKRPRGWAYLGLTIAGAAFSYHSYRNYLDLENEAKLINQEYLGAITESRVLSLSDELHRVTSKRDQYFKKATISGIGSLGLYIVSLIDITITKPEYGFRLKVGLK